MNNDILFYTCQFLSTDDLKNCRLVSKTWLQIVNSVLHNRCIDFLHDSQLDFVLQIKPRITLYWNHYTNFSVSQLTRVTNLHLFEDVSLCDIFVDIETLYIYSPVTNLPDCISNLVKLQQLDVSTNTINYIPSSFFSLKNLTILNFSCNHLTDSINEGINSLVNLKTLNLSYNYLTRLQLKLPNLRDLKVTGNSLIKLDLHDCTSLTTCIANFNQLDEIPYIPSIISIEMIENKLTCISPNIQFCRNLKRLCLYRNQIQFVSNYINLCPLFYLNLSQNDIKNIALCIPTLMDLYLDGNAFIKVTFYNCISLVILSLSHCFIYTIPIEWSKHTRNLIFINLDYNGLLNVNGIEYWSRLKHLNLSYNCLNSIPSCLYNLDYLNLTCNYLKNVPNELQSIKKLIL